MAPTSSKLAPAQHQQPSRKGKKAWRKNVDILQVQEGLAQLHEEEIHGGVIAEKPSQELFVVDPTGSEEIKARVAKDLKPLKADQILAQRSAIPAVSTRIVRPTGVSNGVTNKSTKRSRGMVSREEFERLRHRAYGGEKLVQNVTKDHGTPDEDLWASLVKVDDPNRSFLPTSRSARAPTTLKHAPITLLKGNKVMPAVAKPRPGTSYNPAFDDWDALLEQEGAKAVAAEQKRIETEQHENELAEKIADAQREEEEAEDSTWEGIESASEVDEADHLAARLPRRKTPAERNKVKRRKLREGQEKHTAAMRIRGERGEAMKEQREVTAQLATELARAEAMAADEASSSDEAADDTIQDRILRKRMLGGSRIPAPNLELTLPDELQDSLRRLKPEGNLLRDRFHNLLVRGRVETRRPGEQRKKGKRMKTEKWSYKDFEVPGLTAR